MQKGMPRAFGSLRNRNFRLFWIGQTISNVGIVSQTTAQAWLILRITHSGGQLGLVAALQTLPIFFSPFARILADRYCKQRILLATRSAAMIQAFLLWTLIVTGTVRIWHLYILALVLGFINSLDIPTCWAYIVELIRLDDFPSAIALSASQLNLARIAGASLGGIIIATCGIGLPVLLNAISFLPMIVMLLGARRLHARPPSKTQQNPWQSLREGLNYIRQTPQIPMLLVTAGLVLLFGWNFGVVLPLYAGLLKVGAQGFGFLSAAISLGSLISSLWLAGRRKRPTAASVLIGSLIFGMLEVAFAVSRCYPLSLILIVGVGAAGICISLPINIILQSTTPLKLRGRTAGLYAFIEVNTPLGFALAGWLADAYGASISLLMCAFACIATTAVGWLWHKAVEKRADPPA